mgnify:CR=1 FL=1
MNAPETLRPNDAGEAAAAADTDADRYTVPGLERGLRILTAFSRSEPTLTAPELARRLAVPRTTVFRLLVTLEQMGFVERLPDGRSYRLALAVLRLGFEYIASQGLVEHARPLLEALRDATGYSAGLVVRDGRDVVYLYRSMPRSPFATTVAVGTRLPAHATVLGHVLLAELSREELGRLYPERKLEPVGAHPPPTVDALYGLTQRARERGHVLAEAYFEPHICTVCAPVRDASGRIAAAIGLTVPGERIPVDQHTALIERVVVCARELSARLDAPAAGPAATTAPAIRPARAASTEETR